MSKKKIILPLFFITSLASCNIAPLLTKTKYVKETEFPEIKKDEEGEGYYRIKEYKTLKYGKSSALKDIKSLRDIYSSGISHYNAPSTGNIYALVIPVNFIDSDKSNNERQKIIINNALFGSRKSTSYESLSSFYDYSSYGQLSFDGMVTDFYEYPYKAADLNKSGTSSISSKIAGNALKWFYDNNPNEDMAKYDQDNDGFIDTLFIIYNYPSSDSSSSLWWAYADHMSLSVEGNVNRPYGSSYTWLSYDFLEKKKNIAETHVAIHESGHLFGLQDYYNTNSNAYFQPTGYVDMMDRNIGDHTGYSKMLLNWTTPYVTKGSGSITLKPFTTSGDLLLIPTNKGWNQTPYDEYLLLEYYVPTGLYKKEAGTKYVYKDKSGQQKVFTFLKEMGLKVYHVDSRIGYFDSRFAHNLLTVLGDDDEQEILENRSNFCIDFAYSNTISDSKALTSPVLYHLLQKGEKNTLLDGVPFEGDSLFKKGDSFGVNDFKNFKFNNGSSLTYSFEITDMNSGGITISFNELS